MPGLEGWMTVDKILDERGSKYGNYLRLATMVEELLHILSGALGDTKIEPDQADALRMICVKLARICNGSPHYADSWRDIAGYATLVADRLEGKTR